MLQYLKDHIPETVATLITIVLVVGFAIVASFLSPAFQLSWPIIPIALVAGGFAMAITNGIRGRINNTPDWPWFDGLTEDAVQPSIRDESNEYAPINMNDSSYSDEETHDSVPMRQILSSSNAVPVQSSSKKAASFIKIHTDAATRSESGGLVKERAKQVQASHQANESPVGFKHETVRSSVFGKNPASKPANDHHVDSPQPEVPRI